MKIKDLRVAYFSDLEFPSNTVATKQIAKTADTLCHKNLSIELYLPVPWKNLRWHRDRRISAIRNYYGISKDLKIREYIPVLPMAKRLHRPASGYLMIQKLKRQRYDLIYVRNFFHLKLALHSGQNVLFETYKFLLTGKTMQTVVRALHEHRSFVGMIVHSEMARRHWLAQGAEESKIITIHNGIDASEVPQRMDRAEARRLLRISEEEKIICYTGNIGKDKGIESILAVAKYLPEIRFNIVGAKNKKDIQRLKQSAEKDGLRNISLIGWLPPTKVYPYLFSADALIIPPTNKPLLEAGKTALPIKTFMYLASGVPILAPALEDTAEILKDNENARLLRPDAPEENALEIKKLFEDKALLIRLGAQARETSKLFTWEHRAAKIISFIESRAL
jgi:glycosyltransferase involved in cell wall biosynthesis